MNREKTPSQGFGVSKSVHVSGAQVGMESL